MDVSVSVSFFQDELASTIEHAVKAAVDTVLCEITKVVGGKFTEFQMEMAGKEKENESLKLRLEISESELKAVRECMNAADADIKQPLRNMNPDCNEQDFQRNENQGLFIRVQGGLCVFTNVSDLATINSFILYKERRGKKRTRRKHVLPLASELRHKRFEQKRSGKKVPAAVGSDRGAGRKRRQCQVAKCNGNKTVERCAQCAKAVCGTCTVYVEKHSFCVDCTDA
ncbi:UNVERIFIED_CONTAM: hypothetical protein FKN15_053357 [Acipenser sinensis]